MATKNSVGSLGFDLRGYSENLHKDINKALSKVEGQMKKTSRRLTSVGTKMSAAITLPLVALGKIAVDSFGKQEAAESKLRAALQATGQEVEKNFASFKKLAGEIQGMTVIGDEASIEYAALATNMGITADQLGEVTKGAIGLSEAFGLDMQLAIKAASAALQGKTELLTRYIPTLSLLETQSEKVAFVQQKMAQGFEQAKAAAMTNAGAIQQMKNAIGDAFEVIGGQLAPSVKGLADGIKNLAVTFQNLNPELRETIVNVALVAAAIGPVTLAIGLTIGAIAKLIPLMAVAFSPAVLAGIVAIGGAMVVLYNTSETAAEGMDKAAASTNSLADMIRALATPIANVTAVFQVLFDTIKAGFKLAEAGVHSFIGTFYDLRTAALVTAQAIDGAFVSVANRVKDTMKAFTSAQRTFLREHGGTAGALAARSLKGPSFTVRDPIDFSGEIAEQTALANSHFASGIGARGEAQELMDSLTSGDSFFGTRQRIADYFYEAADSATEFQEAALPALESTGAAAAEMQESLVDFSDFVAADAAEGYGAASEAIQAAANESTAALQATEEQTVQTAGVAVEEFSHLNESVKRNFSDTLETLFSTGKVSFADLGGALASSFIRDFSDTLAKGLVDSFNMISGFLNSSATTSGGGGISWGGIVSSIFGGFFAEGGRPPMGKVSVVGESGPELFIPDTAGEIIPNRMLAGEGSGSGPQIVVNQQFSSGVSEAMLQRASVEIRRETTSGIIEAIQRGGVFRKRMQS